MSRKRDNERTLRRRRLVGLVEEWTDEAAEYARRARLVREQGDPAYAEELEAIAADYTEAAGLLELQLGGRGGARVGL